jgi:hypothetical protein
MLLSVPNINIVIIVENLSILPKTIEIARTNLNGLIQRRMLKKQRDVSENLIQEKF